MCAYVRNNYTQARPILAVIRQVTSGSTHFHPLPRITGPHVHTLTRSHAHTGGCMESTMCAIVRQSEAIIQFIWQENVPLCFLVRSHCCLRVCLRGVERRLQDPSPVLGGEKSRGMIKVVCPRIGTAVLRGLISQI